jgi:hypothetical protein
MVRTTRAMLLGRAIVISGICAAAIVAGSGAARSQDESYQQQLFEQMTREPTNYDVTFEYVRVATARGDYEAAINALERLLFYQPNLPRVKYELGTLYFRMGSYEMAKRYFLEASQSPTLNDVTRERIATYLPDAEKQLQQNRFYGFVNAGTRYQSNANFAPTSGTIRLGGLEFALLPTVTRKPDWNAFVITGLSHEYDLENQRGDVLETRFIGYATHQFRFDDLDVALFDASWGPRLALAPDLIPGATIKPYAVGGNAWVGGSSYLSTAGAGIVVQVPFNDRFTVGPDFEWRRAIFDNNDIIPVSNFGSGNWYTAGVSATVKFNERSRLDSRGLYRRGNDADLPWQNFNQWVGEAALTIEFQPPFEMMSRNWSIAPYARVIKTEFGAANPFIDPTIVRSDLEWIAGVMFNAPLIRNFGFSATAQYDRVRSTIINFTQDNFSVMLGPTARF